VSNREWEKAEEIGWETYYRWVEGRDLRQVFVDALPCLPEADDDRERLAIDLGCGDGKEALVLLERGWTVLAVDGAPEGIARLVDAVPPGDAGRLTTKIAAYAEKQLQVRNGILIGIWDESELSAIRKKIGVQPA